MGKYLSDKEICDYQEQIDSQRQQLATMTQAVGLATTIKGDMEISDDPIDMMQQVAAYVKEQLAHRDMQIVMLRNTLNKWLVSPQGERNSTMHEAECVKSTLETLSATEPPK